MTGWIKANLTHEWEAQRRGEINSGNQQTPCVRRVETEGKEKAGRQRVSSANQEREVCQDRPAN